MQVRDVLPAGSRVCVTNRKTATISPVTSLFVLALLVQCCLVSSSPAVGIVSFVVFSVWCARVVRDDPFIAIKYLPFAIGAVLNILGCVVCEYGSVYLRELRVTSHYSGSLPLMLLGYWLFFMVIVNADRWLANNRRQVPSVSHRTQNASIASLLGVVFLGACCAALAHVLTTPAALVGMGRFSFSSTYLSGIWGSINAWLGLLVVIPALLTREPKTRKLGWLCIALYVVYLFWIGTKFGGYYNVAILLVFTHFESIKSRGTTFLLRLLPLLVMGFLGMILFAGLMQVVTTSESDFVDYLLQRLAMQGQLWWRTYDLFGGSIHLAQLSNEVNGLMQPIAVAENLTSNYGIYNIMHAIAPSDIVDAYLTNGVRFSEAGFATAMYSLGASGIAIFSVVMGVLVAGLTVYGLRILDGSRSVAPLCWWWLYLTTRTVFSMGTPNNYICRTGVIATTVCVLDAFYPSASIRAERGCHMRLSDISLLQCYGGGARGVAAVQESKAAGFVSESRLAPVACGDTQARRVRVGAGASGHKNVRLIR